MTRRQLLKTAGGGFGLLGLASLLESEGMLETALPSSGANDPAGMLAQNPMAAPRASAGNGEAGHLVLRQRRAQPCRHLGPQARTRQVGRQIHEGVRPDLQEHDRFLQGRRRRFDEVTVPVQPAGECGKIVSEIFPNLGRHVDKMAFIHSGFTESNNHSPALFMMNTGFREWAIRASARGSHTAWGARTRSFPVSS